MLVSAIGKFYRTKRTHNGTNTFNGEKNISEQNKLHGDINSGVLNNSDKTHNNTVSKTNLSYFA